MTHKNPTTGKSFSGRIHSTDKDGKYHKIRTTNGDLEYVEAKHTSHISDESKKNNVYAKMKSGKYADGKSYNDDFKHLDD